MAISRILAVRNDRFGEFLLTVPALYELKQVFPKARLTLVVSSYVRTLAGRLAFVDEVIVWEKKKHTFAGFLRLAKEYKGRHYDLCVIFNPCKAFNIISFLAGIPLRVGYNRKWGFLLNRKIEDRKFEGLKHEVEYNLELLKTIGITPKLLNNASLRVRSEATDEAVLMEIREEDFSDSKLSELGLSKGEFAVIHPWSSNKEKEWPQDRFKELVVKIADNLGLKCAVIGGSEEVSRAIEFCRDLPACLSSRQMVNLAGKTSLIESAALLKKSKLLITNDSGPMHLAAAAGTPVAAIFRKSPPAVNSRRWGPVGNNHVVIENDIISNITVAEVLDGIKKILTK